MIRKLYFAAHIAWAAANRPETDSFDLMQADHQQIFESVERNVTLEDESGEAVENIGNPQDDGLWLNEGRRLYETWLDSRTVARKCKVDCIDNFKTFCPSANFQAGFCCKSNEDCPRATICSNDNPGAPEMFKYVTCPNVKACDLKNIYPKRDGKVITRQVDTKTNQMVKDDLCSYIIHTPGDMQANDELLVQIDMIENARVYVAKAKDYLWNDSLDRIASNGDKFDARMG